MNKKSNLALKNLKELIEFQKARGVLFYYSINNEVRTHSILSEFIDKKKLFLPAIIKPNYFEAIQIQSLDDLKIGLEKIPEPIIKKVKTYQSKYIETVILPGVAFDKSGVRLGMGKGYYDRYLKRYPHLKKIGLAYEEQVLDSVPKESYDMNIDILVTDKNIYFCRPGL